MRGRLMLGLGAGVVLALLGAAPAMAMAIYVDPPSGGTRVQLDVEPSDSIENIRAKVEDVIGMPPSLQALFWQGHFLQDGRTLSDYSIQRDSVLQLERRYPASAAIAVYIATPAGGTLTLDMEAGDSVEALRQKIEDRLGPPSAVQQLTVGTYVVEDGFIIGDYGIHDGSIVTLGLPAPGWDDSTLGAPQIGVPYSDGVALAASGLETTYSVSAGALPGGLTIDPATGSITGSPTSSDARFTIRASNAAGVLDRAFEFGVAPATADSSTDTTSSPSGGASPAAAPAAQLAETGVRSDVLVALATLLLLAGGGVAVGNRVRTRAPRS